MGDRKKIPPAVAAKVVATARRRCCICFALGRDLADKPGQISHLDRDPSNNDPDNLAYLCLEHHDDYDTRRSQSKGFTAEEVKRYRAELYGALLGGSTVSLAPDIRVGASCALAAPSPGVHVDLLVMSVENHSGHSVFVRSLHLEMTDGAMLYFPRSFLTGELNSRRELRSGECMKFNVSLPDLFADGRKPDQVAGVVAIDEINRTFRFGGQELAKIMKALYERHIRTGFGAGGPHSARPVTRPPLSWAWLSAGPGRAAGPAWPARGIPPCGGSTTLRAP